MCRPKGKMKKLIGIVQDGRNNANIWLRRFTHVYAAWLGQEIFPGSLNVDIGRPFDWHASDLLPFRRKFSLAPHGGERDLFIVPCTVTHPGKQACWLWTTTTTADNRDNPNVVELVASVHLRSRLGLTTGSRIEAEYPEEWQDE
jgi:CTP-dependent riboflavin kinase